MPTKIKHGFSNTHSYLAHEKAASNHKGHANRHQRSAARGRARELALKQKSDVVAFDDDWDPSDLLGKAVLGVLSVLTLPVTMGMKLAEKHPMLAAIAVLGGCVVGAMAAPFQAAEEIDRTAASMDPNVSEATASEDVEDCAQYSVRSIEGLHKHSKCILKKTGRHPGERPINHHLKSNPGFTVIETSTLEEISSLIPAIKMVSAIIDSVDDGAHNHTMHGRELLKHVLGVPVHSLSHEEVDHMCGLTQMFDPVQQASDIAGQFIGDIKLLIHDRELTSHMRFNFQKEYLAHFREIYPQTQWNAFVQGFNSIWIGGPTESALLMKAIEDIDIGKPAFSWSPEVVHGLTLASHAWRTTVAALLPEKVALDSLVALGKSIYHSRAKFCDYVRTAATVAMSVGMSAGEEGMINEGRFIERKIPDLGRARSVAEIRKNALVFQSKNHKIIYPNIENEMIETLENTQSNIDQSLGIKTNKIDIRKETMSKNNGYLRRNTGRIRKADRGSRRRVRCRREGVDLCLPGAGKPSGDRLGVSGAGARKQTQLKFENSLRENRPKREEIAKEKPPWNRNPHTGVEVHLGVKKCSGAGCSRVRHQKSADDLVGEAGSVELPREGMDAETLVAKSVEAQAKRTRHRESREWGQRDNSPLLGPFKLDKNRRGEKSKPMFPAKNA